MAAALERLPSDIRDFTRTHMLCPVSAWALVNRYGQQIAKQKLEEMAFNER
jgi:hypothetical protein